MAMQHYVEQMGLYDQPIAVHFMVDECDWDSNFGTTHPLWKENAAFLAKAREIHRTLLKEKLGLFLEVEE